jgi:transcriptional regulator with XRE-family HTH domain
MTDPGDARALRQELGRGLKAARVAAGYSQAQLALKTEYQRGTVSAVESGDRAARVFWQRCDAALGTGTALTAAYDRSARLHAAGRNATARGAQPGPAGRAGRALDAATVAEAAAAYRELGWRAEQAGGRVELVCGTGVEALEVPRAAGVLAVRWWLHTGGVPDEIRRLPGLPSPRDALVVIAAGDRFLFLVQSGACPWAGPGPAGMSPSAEPPGAVVRWHAGGSTIPAPPPAEGSGQQAAAWAHPPPGRPRLADPVILLDLLARAVATASHQRRLRMPGGTCVVPATNPAAPGEAQ